MRDRSLFRGSTPVWMLLAVVSPVAVGILFPHPTTRIVLPWTVIVSIAVLLTVAAGRGPGLVAALVGAVSVWYFNFAPSYSFRPANDEDAIAGVVIAIAGCVLVLLVDAVLRRQRQTQSAFVVQGRALAEIQRALLPPEPLTIPGVAVGFAYEPGGDEAPEVGGDWLAIVPLSDTRLGIAVGDVTGHGIDAVRTMVEYRFALRTIGTETEHPAAVLERVDRVASTYKTAHFSTAVYGVVDTISGLWSYSSAGHPPPLLVHRDRSIESLDGAHGPPLGIGLARTDYSETTVPLQRGDLIAVYTDGVVERRREDIAEGIHRLTARIAAVTGDEDLTGACGSILRDLVGPSHPDDAALVLVRLNDFSAP